MSVLLLNGNALSIPLADGSVHMVVTSPPYFNARKEYASWPTYQDYLDDMAQVWRECYRVLCDGGRIAVNVPEGYYDYRDYKPIGADTEIEIKKCGFALRGTIIWHKFGICNRKMAWGSWLSATNPSLQSEHEIIIVANKGNPGRQKGKNTIDKNTFMDSVKSVWPITPISNHWHPAPFPAEIPRRLIELYTFQGDIVLDPFSGSGTTANTANDLGRHGIGIDLSRRYLVHGRQETIEYQLYEWTHGKSNGKAGELEGLPLFELKEAGL